MSGALELSERLLREATDLALRVQSTVPSTSHVMMGSLVGGGDGIEELREQIGQLRVESERLATEVAAINVSSEVAAAVEEGGHVKQQLHTLSLLERRLQHELSNLEREIDSHGDAAASLDTNKRVDAAAAKEQVTRTIRELHETLPLVRQQIAEAREDLERVLDNRDSLQKLNDELLRRRDAGAAAGGSQQQTAQRLAERTRAIKAETNDFMVALVQFIEKFYPPMTIDLPDGTQRDSSIKTLLEDLMNQAIVRPNDSYVSLDVDHWPPYVELLVRAGIAVKDPEDGSKLKLVDFHR